MVARSNEVEVSDNGAFNGDNGQFVVSVSEGINANVLGIRDWKCSTTWKT